MELPPHGGDAAAAVGAGGLRAALDPWREAGDDAHAPPAAEQPAPAQQQPQQQQQQPQQQQGQGQQQPQQQQGQGHQHGQQRPAPDLRVVAYLHYEQLLPALAAAAAAGAGTPALPQTFPLRPRPALDGPASLPPPPPPEGGGGARLSDSSAGSGEGGVGGGDAGAAGGSGSVARVASETAIAAPRPRPSALLLHLDFCRLRGGASLGAAVVRLRLRRWGAAAVQYEAAVGGADISVVRYRRRRRRRKEGGGDDGSGESSSSSGGGDSDSSSSASGSSSTSSSSGSEDEAAPAGETSPRQRAAGQKAQPASGAGAGAALEALAGADEVMADLALFDAGGRLLTGRAGVELWSKEGTVLAPSADHGGDMVAVARRLYLLHWLPDGLPGDELWDCRLELDPAPAARGGGRVALRLSWRALAAMYPQQQQQP